MNFLATCPAGVADLLAAEILAQGAAAARELRGGVEFNGPLEIAYRVCLWSRTASRVLLRLAEVPGADAKVLYDGVRSVDWSAHLVPEGTLAVDFTGTSSGIAHTNFGAQRVKDAIVDGFRARCGKRPSVDLRNPDLRVNVHLRHDVATLAIDLSGESLHRRGYRLRGVAAPLKENLAAAILLRSGWPALAAQGWDCLDPLCGSGTLIIEAALMATDTAPGLLRERFGFERWCGHQPKLWQQLVEEARERRLKGRVHRAARYLGFDHDAAAVRAAIANAERAGLGDEVHFEHRTLAALERPSERPGLLVTNPPYGERIGEINEIRNLYRDLGAKLREQFVGWKATILTANPPQARELGLRARRSHTLWNGPIECRLLRFDIAPGFFASAALRPTDEQRLAAARAKPGAQMFANRLAKNLRTLKAWIRREGIACYRAYDADMPEYAFAIDIYGNEQQWAYVQEYEAPASIDRQAAAARRLEALSVIPQTLGIPADHIRLRLRRAQKGTAQYEKLGESGEFHIVRESRYRFLVNFTDYLDTGLFLDHRLTRARIGELASGRRFLNLFAYTGSATVHAVGGGATTSTTVDMSRTYLDWAKRNLALNGLAGPAHDFVQADCLRWLEEQADGSRHRYDLIFVDPPTHSRSKRMAGDFDVQRDHVGLLELAARLLAPDGIIVFSSNYSRFKLDRQSLSGFDCEDITRLTVPRDFIRNPRIHVCFELRPVRRHDPSPTSRHEALS